MTYLRREVTKRRDADDADGIARSLPGERYADGADKEVRERAEGGTTPKPSNNDRGRLARLQRRATASRHRHDRLGGHSSRDGGE